MSADATRVAKRIQAEAQAIADDAWRFTLAELKAVAPLYDIDMTGKTFGELRHLIATRRAAWCRPQADPVVLADYEGVTPLVSEEEPS